MIPEYLAYIIASLTCAGTVWSLFQAAANATTPKYQRIISKHLKRLEVNAKENWPSNFIYIFDSVFGRRHLSIRCFVASSIASLTTIAVLIFLKLIFKQYTSLELYEVGSFRDIVIMALSFNLILDYVSLLQTRYWLSLLKVQNNLVYLLLIVVGDFILTTLTVYLGVLLYYSLIIPLQIFGSIFPFSLYFGLAFSIYWDLTFQTLTFMSTFIFSTYLTSAWLWLFLISSSIIRVVIIPTGHSLRFLKSALDIDHKPIESIGLIATIFVFFLLLVIFIIL